MGSWAKHVQRAHCTDYTCNLSPLRLSQENCEVMGCLGYYVNIFCLKTTAEHANKNKAHTHKTKDFNSQINE